MSNVLDLRFETEQKMKKRSGTEGCKVVVGVTGPQNLRLNPLNEHNVSARTRRAQIQHPKHIHTYIPNDKY